MRTFTILCVDDERNVLITLRAQLQRHFPDCTIEIAESGAEALELVEELLAEGADVPLVIADQIMPEMKGDQFLIELHRRHPQILKVMLTGQATAEDVGNVVNQGNLYRFLSKPWNETDLQLTVQEALRRHQQEQQIAQQQIALEQANQQIDAVNTDLEQQIQERTQQLWQSQQQLELFVEHVPAAVALFDREMRYLAASQRWKQDYGIAEQSLIGRSHYEVFPDIPERWKAIHQCCLAGAVERCEEDCFVRADGSVVWNQWEIRPWYISTGEIGGIVMFTQVTTEQKQAEEALRQSDSRLLNAQRVAHLGIWEFDLATQKITWSEELFRMFGLDPAQGEPSYEAYQQQVHPDDRAILQTAIHQAIAQGTPYEVEHRIYHPDGSVRYILGRGEAVRSAEGQIVKLMGTALDQTSRKLAELALRESEARNRAIVTAIPDIMIVIDASGHYLSFSFSQFSGEVIQVASDVTGLHITQVLPEEIARQWLIAIQQALQTGEVQIHQQQIQFDDRTQYEEVRFVPYQADKVLCMVRNITEQKQAELALQESELRLRRLSENLPGVVYRYVQYADGSDAFLYISPQSQAVYGFPPEAIMQNSSLLWSAVHPDDLATLQSEIALSLQDPTHIFYVEHRTITPTGEIRWIQATSRPDLQPTGDVIWDGVVIDITARKRAEAALQESQNFIEQIATSSPSVIYIYDLVQQRSVYVNKQVCTFLGYGDNELEALADYSIADLMHPDDLRQAMQHFQRLAALPDGEIAEFEYRMQHQSGEWRWFCSRDTVFKRDADGNVTQISGNAQDITRRKVAEAALQESERRLSMALAAAKAGVWDWDIATNQTYWSDENFRLMGFEPGAVETTYDTWVQAAYPEDQERANQAVAQVIAEGTDLNLEYRVLLPDGSVRWLGDIGQIVRDEQGNAIGMAGIQIDITDRKQAEIELQRREAQLTAVATNVPGGVFRIVRHAAHAYSSLFVSEGYRTLCGLEPEQIYANPNLFISLIHPDDRERHFAAWEAAIQNLETFYGESRYILPTGEIKWIATRAQFQPQNNGDVIIDGLDIDVTDRKQLELELSQREAFLNSIYNGLAVAISVVDVEPDGTFRIIDFNPVCDQYTGIEMQSLRGKTLDVLAPYMEPASLEAMRQYYQQCVATGETIQYEVGSLVSMQAEWWLSRLSPLKDETGRVYRIVGTSIPITERKRAESQLATQNALLARIARGEQLSEILHAVVAQIEQQLPGAMGSVLLLDETNRLRHGAAPHLPQAYCEAVDGVQIGDGIGSCGTAAYLKQTVISSDIATDSNWINYRALALAHGLQACWSTPIVAADGKVPGTFGVYYAELRSPKDHELNLLAQVANIAGIAIERELAEAKIRRSEEQLQLTLDFAGIGAWNWNPTTDEYIWNDTMIELLELPPNLDNMFQSWQDRIHPDDAAQVEASIQTALRTRQSFTVEYRYQLSEGRFAWRWAKGQGIYSATGEVEQVLGVLQDITERKQAEEALRLTEAKQRALVSALPDLIMRIDSNGVFLDFIAPGAFNVIGRTDNYIGTHVLDTLTPELSQRRMNAIHAALQTGELQIYEQEIFANGVLQTEECRVVICAENEVLVIVRDISERKQAELALRESEARFRELAETVKEGFFVGEPFDLKFNYVNPAYEAITGFTASELYANGACWLNFMHPDDRKLFDASFHEEGQQQTADQEYRYFRPDTGEERWMRAQVFPILDETDRPKRVVGTLEDITDRKRTEVALRDSEERRRLALDLTGTGSWEFGVATGEAIWSDSHYRLMGLVPGECPSNYQIWCERVHPDDLVCVEQAFAQALATDSLLDIEYRVVYPDGTVRWVLTKGQGVYDASGQAVRMLGVMVDVTDRKLAEQALQQLNDKLELRVQQRTQALVDSQAQLQAKEQFLRGIFEGTETPIFVLDVLVDGSFRYVGWNRAAEVMTAVSSADALNKSPQEVFGEETGSRLANSYRRCYEAGEAVHYEEHVWYNEQEVWVMTSLNPLRDVEGRIYRIVGSTLDILELKRTEQALQRSEQDLRTIFDNVYDALLIHDLDGKPLDVNQRAVDLYGTTREALLDATIAEMSGPDAPMAIVPGLLQQIQAGETVQIEWQSRRLEDGFAFPSEVSLRPVTLGNRPVFIASVRDITERKQAEARLRDQEQFLRSIYEGVQQPIFVGDVLPDNSIRVMGWNPATAKLAGRSSEEIAGKAVDELFPPDQATEMLERYADCIATRQPATFEEQVTFQGQTCWMLSTYNPLINSEGRVHRVVGTVYDITERKQAERALQQAEQDLRTIFNNVYDCIYIHSLDGTILDVNERTLELNRATREQMLRASIADLSPPGAPLHRLSTLFERVQAGENVRFEWTCQRLGDRSIFESEVTLRMATLANRSVCIATVRDISDRKQAELALRDSEERFRQLAESINGVFWLTDLQPQILYVSPAFERIWQRTPEEVFGSHERFLETIHPDDHAHTTREMARRFEQNVDVEYRILRPSGEVRWIRDRTFHIYNEAGELYRLAGLAEDITEQKQTQIALHEARQFAQSIADKTPAMLYIYDLVEQCNCYSNQALTELLGYTEDAIVTMGSEIMPFLLHPDDLEKVVQHHQSLIAADDGVDLELEYRMRHANGNWRWFYSRDSIFKRDAEGNVTQYIGAAQDVTERKRLEQDLRQINAELEQRVAERTQDLQHAMEAAQAANQAKTTFLANMSHELRTPLNAILGFSQLLNRDHNLTVDQQEQVKIINRSGEHLLNLINDILAMSKIEAGRTTLTVSQFDLRELLQDLEELFRLKAEAKQLQLTMQIHQRVPALIQADESKLRQVLINLLNNAIKFTLQGSVTLRIWPEQNAVPTLLETAAETTAETQSFCLHFEVEDTGCGIDPTEQAIVFEPFGQTQSGRNAQEGTGLGLPISRQFVQLMGGELYFTSIPHQGSTFYFTIPVEAVAVDDWLPNELTDRVVGLAADQPSYRLLVVEDNLENQQFLVQLLSAVGFEVQIAVNGQEAIEWWHIWSPDLIWMDMRMPVMDGYAATRQIRTLEQQKASRNGQHSTASETKILALTASAFEDERSAILAAGCNDFLFKPITEAILFDKIAEHLGVRYIYETQVVLQSSPVHPSDDWLTSQELRRMPPEWVAELRYAARIADEDLILRVLDQLPPTEARLTEALRELVNALQIERLIELTQNAEDAS